MDSVALWLDQAHFLRPWWLLALLPAALLLLALWLRRQRAGAWQRIVEPHLLPFLLQGSQDRRQKLPLWGLLALWVLVIIALAGPAWQQLPEPVQKSGSALIVAWDMSPSMMAQDIKPSRLERSRLKLMDLLRARKEGTTGLVAYAGEAHAVTPLTDDAETVISLLPALTPANMPVAGSNPEMAVEMAFELLLDAGIPRGDVLLVTDEIVPEAFDRLARIARRSDHQITIWGVGTEDGAPIPLPRGGFARDRSGNIVVPTLNEDALQDFASDIGAYYVPMLQTDEDIETLQRLFDTQPTQLRETDRVFDDWYEHGPWLLILALPLAALAFRRGWIMCLALVALLPLGLPQPAHALSWQDLWKTPDQQGREALERENPQHAAQLFENPNWRGTAHYRAENYEEALKAFRQGEDSARSLYNQGNALLRLGDYQAAINAYNETLKRNPGHEYAKHNRRLAQQLLEQQKAQQGGQAQQGPSQNDPSQEGQADEGQGSQEKSGDTEQNSAQAPQEQNPNSSSGPDGQQQGSSPDNAQQENDGPYDDPSNNTENPPREEQASQQGAQESVENQADAEESPAEQSEQADVTAESERQAREAQVGVDPASEAEREQQQALEQWLRRVPDDPGGLLRNKFQHEYRERRLTGDWTAPNNNATERW